MPLVLPISFREDDLSHVADAISRSAEEILACAQLPVSCASRLPWGILIKKPNTRRRWRRNSDSTERLHLLDQVALAPELGVFALFNRALDNIPAARDIAVCPWFHRAMAAQYLWAERLGFYGYDRHVIEAYLTLGLEERPSNNQSPGYSRIRHGVLLRFDAATAQAARRHFVLDALTPAIEPTVMPLGGSTCLVFADSDDPSEPLRAMIVDHEWSARMATKELRRWQRSKTLSAV